MIWNDHSELKGSHALFSPSRSSWENYDEQTMFERYNNSFSTTIGTVLHEEAEWRISKGLRLNSGEKNSIKLALYRAIDIPNDVIDNLEFEPIFSNLRSYVNDAIGYRMRAEQILYNNDLCYGTADAIIFNNNFLRIHDLKTGTTPAKMEQLLKYAALFCLEYKVDPHNIQSELRIYQMNDILIHNPEPEEILEFCDAILRTNKLNNEITKRRN